jgi:enoyl-CoA hydratase/carnithine racemase
MVETSTPLIDTATENGIITITLDRPEKLNAVDYELAEGLQEVFSELEAESTKPLIVRGNGDATCAGTDTEIVGDSDYEEKYADYDEILRDALRRLDAYPAPTAMAGHGAVVGTGFGLAMACDLVVLAEETHFSLPEVTYGARIGDHVLSKLLRNVGPRVTKEIAITGEPIGLERAVSLGLVNRVVPADDVYETTVELMADVAEYDTQLVAGILEAADEW